MQRRQHGMRIWYVQCSLILMRKRSYGFLCTCRLGDFWGWHEEPRGTFSVRSAYRMILRTKHSREAWLYEEDGTSYEHQETKKWSMIWHMQVPSKLKVFVWRLVRQSMPTGSLLKHRHMATEHTCLICGAVDTWKHALISCPMAASVWALAPDEILTKDLFDRLMVTLWALWYASVKQFMRIYFRHHTLSTASYQNIWMNYE